MMKNNKKFLNKDPLPWVSFVWENYYSESLTGSKMEVSRWWKKHLKLLPDYKANFDCKIGNGHAAPLWHDCWLDQPLVNKFLELHSFVKSDLQTVASWIIAEDPTLVFHTPFSSQA